MPPKNLDFLNAFYVKDSVKAAVFVTSFGFIHIFNKGFENRHYLFATVSNNYQSTSKS